MESHQNCTDAVVFGIAQGLLDRGHIKRMALLMGGALQGDAQAFDLDRPLVREVARARQQQGVLC